MAKNKVYLLFLVVGVAAGVFWGLLRARADTPEGEISKGESPASVYYDETWNCTGALVSSETGYKDFKPSLSDHTQTAAKFDGNEIKVFPKFVVREWTVHGHIHFE
jgi:hypothetical protein